ncbi:SAM-dependent methyltransferase [Amycolatopsis thailandensis]|uniref:SAM-dependent methyltransferase n=1 Tax=Amycolatopsis thailandensis TaxID=589330 RepID=UPI00362605F5
MSPHHEPDPASPLPPGWGTRLDNDLDAVAAETEQSTVARLNAAVSDLHADRAGAPENTVRRMGWYYAFDRQVASWILNEAPGYAECLALQRRFRDHALQQAVTSDRIRQITEIRTPIPDDGPQPVTVHDLALEYLKNSAEAVTSVLLARERVLTVNLLVDYAEKADSTGHRVAVLRAEVEDIDALHSVLDGDRPLLDRGRPVALSVVDDLHRDPDPARRIRAYRDLLPVGSVLWFTHLAPPAPGSEHAAALDKLRYRFSTTIEPTIIPRGADEIGSWFDAPAWQLRSPGVTTVPRWLGEPEADQPGTPWRVWCGVAEKIR